MSDLYARVLHYLDDHTTLSLATTGPAGLWAAAVLYVRDGLDLYFTSVPTTRHGVNLAEDPHAVGTISDECRAFTEMKGLQIEGEVTQVDDVDERTRVVTAYLRQFPFATGLWPGESDPVKIAAAPGVHAFYRLRPSRVLFTDMEHHPQGREELPV